MAIDMTLSRRQLATGLAATTLVATFGQGRAAAAVTTARNVVLVHGLFADGSSWSEVISRLQAAGLNAISVQNPFTTLDEAVASRAQQASLRLGKLSRPPGQRSTESLIAMASPTIAVWIAFVLAVEMAASTSTSAVRTDSRSVKEVIGDSAAQAREHAARVFCAAVSVSARIAISMAA